MKIAALQHDVVWEDVEANLAALTPQVAAAVGAGAQLILLTEMFATGFSMNTAKTAQPRGGPAETFLREQARTHGVWLAGSVAEMAADDDRLASNTLILVGPDGATHRYRKIHPFSYSGEDQYFAAGDTHVTVDVEGIRVTLFVCYDLRFADEFWATAAETDLYVVVANWPKARREHWRTLLRARAIENQAYVAGVNRVGSGGRLDYVGDSMIIDPMGEILVSAAGGATMLLADIDADLVRETRAALPFMADRR